MHSDQSEPATTWETQDQEIRCLNLQGLYQGGPKNIPLLVNLKQPDRVK